MLSAKARLQPGSDERHDSALLPTSAGTRNLEHASLVLFAVVASALLFTAINDKSFWADELFTLELTQTDIPTAVQRVAGDLHPPLYFLALNLWARLVGESEFALRYLSALAGVATLFQVYALGRKLLDSRLGLLAALLVAVSPFQVLYASMARYYSLTMALALLSTLFFVSFVASRRRASLIGYVVAASALIYTDYPAVSVLVAHNIVLVVLLAWRRRYLVAQGDTPSAIVKRWTLAQMAIFALYLPWMGVLVRSTAAASKGFPADFGDGAFGYLLKVAFPFYSFAVGETILPWRIPAIVGLLATILVFAAGVRFLFQRSKVAAISTVVLLIVPIVSTILIVSFAAPRTPFINIPSRAMFAFPFFSLLLAGGILYNTSKWLRIAALFLMAVGYAFSLANYYDDRDFVNPIYAVPTREIVAEVAAASQPDDVYLSEIDTLFALYYAKAGLKQRHYLTSSEEAKGVLDRGEAQRLWLITFGRDASRLAPPTPPELIQRIHSDYRLVESRGYAEQDELYRKFKETLMRRPAYKYKTLVELYVRK